MTCPIPFYLVTGFLGSGKTTFLKRIVKKFPEDQRIGVIQNEFAPANVESASLSSDQDAYKILEINNGSVFCLCLLHDFIDSLNKFISDYQPDIIILEASGLSDPIAIAQLFDSNQLKNRVYLARIWTVIDALNFSRSGQFIERVEHQIRVADIAIVNKIDLVSDKTIDRVQKKIHNLNPFVNIIQTTYCDYDISTVDQNEEAIAISMKSENALFERSGKPLIKSGVLKTATPISLEQAETLLHKYCQETIRIKGFIKLIDETMIGVQSVYEQVEIHRLDGFVGITELVILGENFDLATFNRDYKLLGKSLKG